MKAARQLALPLPIQDAYEAADFLAAASNEAALAWLDRIEAWPFGRLALSGAAGCGKTHLLRMWAGRTGAVVLDGSRLRDWQGALRSRALAIDNADLVGDETAMLHHLNEAAETARPVLLAGRSPPSCWPVGLPDLRSRLRATAQVEIGLPDEDLLRAMLARLFADRQLAVAQGVQDWMLNRLPRSGDALRDAVGRLDRAALRVGCRITRPFAAAVLATEDLAAADLTADDISGAMQDEPSQPPLAAASTCVPGLL